MDIAAISMSHAQFELMQQASMSVTKKTMEVAEVQMQGFVEMLQAAAPETVSQDIPPAATGNLIDVKA